ncbi:uncharacterized protein LOC118150577 isoform X2 [Callithrix jacchus]
MKPRVTSSRTYARTSRQETLFSLRVLTPASAPGQQGSWRPAAWTNDRKEEKEPEGGKRRGAGQGHQAGVLSSELRHQQARHILPTRRSAAASLWSRVWPSARQFLQLPWDSPGVSTASSSANWDCRSPTWQPVIRACVVGMTDLPWLNVQLSLEFSHLSKSWVCSSEFAARPLPGSGATL